MEVVSGTRTATLYGTDAVNEIILVTTKQESPVSSNWSLLERVNCSAALNWTIQALLRVGPLPLNRPQFGLHAAHRCNRVLKSG